MGKGIRELREGVDVQHDLGQIGARQELTTGPAERDEAGRLRKFFEGGEAEVGPVVTRREGDGGVGRQMRRRGAVN